MKTKELRDKLQRVANTLCATKLRVDQIEATDRIRACTRELIAVIDELEEESAEDESDTDDTAF